MAAAQQAHAYLVGGEAGPQLLLQQLEAVQLAAHFLVLVLEQVHLNTEGTGKTKTIFAATWAGVQTHFLVLVPQQVHLNTGDRGAPSHLRRDGRGAAQPAAYAFTRSLAHSQK